MKPAGIASLGHSARPVAAASTTAAICWLRRDLRLCDNAALLEACASSYLLPCYVLDPRELQPRRSRELGGLHVPKLGPHRCKFLLESLHCLKAQLRRQGSDLVFQIGRPESIIPSMALQVLDNNQAIQHISLHYQADMAPELEQQEQDVEAALQAAVQPTGATTSVHRTWGMTLLHPDDLPSTSGRAGADVQAVPTGHNKFRTAGVASMPGVMTDFRKVIANVPVRAPLPAPCKLPQLPPAAPAGIELPSSTLEVYMQAGAEALQALEALCKLVGLRKDELLQLGSFDARSAFKLSGGPLSGAQRLRYYMGSSSSAQGQSQVTGTDSPAEDESCRSAQDGEGQDLEGSRASVHAPRVSSSGDFALQSFLSTRALAFGADNSTKFSPFLAQGCLSPRQVYYEVCAASTRTGGAQDIGGACSQLLMHLQIRDFYLLTSLKHGSAVLEPGGLQGRDVTWSQDDQLFQAWAQGKTGFPFVDACMTELAATGWMSNRGRQNVSSFLAKALGQDWRLGAELFESLLLDHDWGVNYVNWNYFAGIGNDPRDRHFKVVTQGMQYDESAELITTWLPPLAHLPTDLKHQPWSMTEQQQQQLGCMVGVDYPAPMLSPSTQVGVVRPDGKGGKAKKGKSKTADVQTVEAP